MNIPNQVEGVSIDTSFVWDMQELAKTEVTSPEFKELLVRLYQNLNSMALVVNAKETGNYPVVEVLSGQRYFSNPIFNSTTQAAPTLREVHRKVINYTTALPNTAMATIPHFITCTAATTFTRIYGVANNRAGTTYLPLPYSSTVLANNIELSVDGTNVYITTGSNRTAYTITYIVLEWIIN